MIIYERKEILKRDKEDSKFANNLIIDLQIGAAHIKEIKQKSIMREKSGY